MSVYITFPFTIDRNSHKLQTSEEERHIRDSLYCILMTHISERYMLTEFGSRIQDYVFEINTNEHLGMLEKEILASIATWGFGIEEVHVELHPQEEKLEIILNYQINGKETTTIFEMEMI